MRETNKTFKTLTGTLLILLVCVSLTVVSSPTLAATSVPQEVGWRSSDYGIQDPTAVYQGNAAYYVQAALGMQRQFPGSRAEGIYTVGYIDTGSVDRLPYEVTNGAPTGISGAVLDAQGAQTDPDTMFTAFDNAGVDIIIAVEPGTADTAQLATLLLNKYKNHSSVKGYLIDTEWYNSDQSNAGGPFPTFQANAVVAAVHAVNSNYQVLIKNFDTSYLTPGWSGVTYISDSCGFSSESAAVSDYVAWANYYSGSPVGYQFGYDRQECGTPDDSLWWKQMGTTPYGYGAAAAKITSDIRSQINNPIYGVYWADFTILTQFPLGYNSGVVTSTQTPMPVPTPTLTPAPTPILIPTLTATAPNTTLNMTNNSIPVIINSVVPPSKEDRKIKSMYCTRYKRHDHWTELGV
jgi:hypothetical protein